MVATNQVLASRVLTIPQFVGSPTDRAYRTPTIGPRDSFPSQVLTQSSPGNCDLLGLVLAQWDWKRGGPRQSYLWVLIRADYTYEPGPWISSSQ